MEKTINIHIDLTRTAENVIEQLGYEIIKEKLSECGLYMYYTVVERN